MRPVPIDLQGFYETLQCRNVLRLEGFKLVHSVIVPYGMMVRNLAR